MPEIVVYKVVPPLSCIYGHAQPHGNPCTKQARYLFNGRPYCKRHVVEIVRNMTTKPDQEVIKDARLSLARRITAYNESG